MWRGKKEKGHDLRFDKILAGRINSNNIVVVSVQSINSFISLCHINKCIFMSVFICFCRVLVMELHAWRLALCEGKQQLLSMFVKKIAVIFSYAFRCLQKNLFNQNTEVKETSEQCSNTFQDLPYELNSCVNVGNCHFYDDEKQSPMMFIRRGRAANRGIKTLQRCEVQTQSIFLRPAVTQNVGIMRIYPKAQK